MKTKLNLIICVILTAIAVVTTNPDKSNADTIICPGSSVKCTVKKGDTTVWSEKDSDKAAMRIESDSSS